MDNLFDDPGYAQVRSEMHDMMRARPGVIVDAAGGADRHGVAT